MQLPEIATEKGDQCVATHRKSFWHCQCCLARLGNARESASDVKWGCCRQGWADQGEMAAAGTVAVAGRKMKQSLPEK